MTSRPVQFTGIKTYFATAALTAALAYPTLGNADSVSTSEWNISADKITKYEDPQSIVAEGNIVLEKRVAMPPRDDKEEEVTSWTELLGEDPEDTELTAEEVTDIVEQEPVVKTTFYIESDWLAYDVDNQEIKARGNVKIVKGDDTILAEQGKVDLNTETGAFTDAVIIRKDDDLHLEGEIIEKTGHSTYHIVKGWAITCKVEPGETPPWSFASSDATVKDEGYAVLKHATFNVKGVPIFYTPYMVIPAKRTRQTGFLFPEISHSENGGFGFNVPFFWNINDSVDMTFFPEYYTERGAMPGVELRYVRDEASKGSFIGSYLDDDLSDPDETEYYNDTGYTHTNSERYWLRGKLDHNFGAGWVTRLDLDYVSDRDYLKEFDSGYTGFGNTDDRYIEIFGRGYENKTDTARTNTLKFLRNWSGQSITANFLAINDVSDSVKEEDKDSRELWKLPSIDYTGVIPIGETGISFDWNADYVNYWREEGTGGHRIDIHPKVSSSIPLSPYLESRAELGVRDTYYIIDTFGDATWDEDDTQNRLLADFEIEIASTLLREFDTDGDNEWNFDHQFRPYMKYNYIPDVDQDDLPRWDSVDSVSERNGITYGIDNYFNDFTGKNTREYGSVKIFQTYDFTDSDEPFSDVSLRINLKPVQRWTFIYDMDWDPYDDGLYKHRLETYYTNTRGDYFSVDYSYNDKSDIDQINAHLNAALFSRWYTELEVEHSIAKEETNNFNVALIYKALCWSIEFETRYTPEDMKYMLIFNLANIGTPLGISY